MPQSAVSVRLEGQLEQEVKGEEREREGEGRVYPHAPRADAQRTAESTPRAERDGEGATQGGHPLRRFQTFRFRFQTFLGEE